jgi:hypothetical protein
VSEREREGDRERGREKRGGERRGGGLKGGGGKVETHVEFVDLCLSLLVHFRDLCISCLSRLVCRTEEGREGGKERDR